MPSFIKLVSVALQVSVFASLVVAGPIPKHWRNSDSVDINTTLKSSIDDIDNIKLESSTTTRYYGPRSVRAGSFNVSSNTSATRTHPRDLFNDGFLKLDGYLRSADDYSGLLQTLALDAKSGKVHPDDAIFQRRSSDALTGFAGAIHSFQVLFKHMGREKGLANYNRNSQLQTLLKQLVNLNKDTLKAVDCLVYELPYLGPVLGPIVYELKCLLDLVLNAVENLTDGILNEVEPLLQACIGSAVQSTCATGFSVLGLCVNDLLNGGLGGLL